MELVHVDDQLSDDEIFFGKLSLKELKKHILWNKYPPNKIPEYNENPEDHNQSLNIKSENESIKDSNDFGETIIESHSEPNLRNSTKSPIISEFQPPCARASDDSFLKLESMVDNLCLSSNMETNVELNNTLDVINYILNNGAECEKDKDKIENEANEKHCSKVEKLEKSPLKTILSPPKSKFKIDKEIKTSPKSPIYVTPLKTEPKTPSRTNVLKTAASNTKVQKGDVFVTPSSNLKSKTTVFKTPAPVLQKEQWATSLKKTPSKSNLYQHISSPVASYIKNCPQVPLLKDVHPKKPLPGPSSIPKFTKVIPKNKEVNKENILLPSVAYKSAKKTKVIEIPDKEKLPRTPWVKQMTTLPKPVVMKHNHREVDIAKRSLMQEESFADLPYRQAEVSVCTQKTAFKLKKN